MRSANLAQRLKVTHLSSMGLVRYHRNVISRFLLLAFCLADIGCSYYKVTSKAERKPAAQPAESSISPDVVIPQLKESQNVIVQFSNGSRITTTFRFRDTDNIYVSKNKKTVNQVIPIDSIDAIKMVDDVDARMYSIARQGGDTLFTLPTFKKGSYIRIFLTDGTALNEFYLRRDLENIYVKGSRSQYERSIPRNTIAYARLASEPKYLVLHYRGQAYHLQYASLNKKQTELSGILEPLPADHQYFRGIKEKGSTRYEPNKGNPTNEVHLYVDGMKFEKANQVTIPVPSISKIEYFGADAGRSAGEAILASIGVLAVLAIVVAATKKSCPFVYAYDGSDYQFKGEIFGGAIYPSLERDDYLPLPGVLPHSNEYKLKIANYLHEVQYTNMADLLIVEHPKHVSVLLDKHGLPHTIDSAQAPLTASSAQGRDQHSKILNIDNQSYLFDDGSPGHDDVGYLDLVFRKPASVTSGKLVLKATNSYWLDYLYGKFNEEFGTYYPRFVEKQGKVPAEKLNAWSRDQHIPLTVYLKTRSGWTPVDNFHVMGPMASRELVMPINLSEVADETITLRLETGFLFWELDYAAMDFTPDLNVTMTRVQPASVVDEEGTEVTSTLLKRDDKYLVQPDIGNAAVLLYPFDGEPGITRSVFLHSSGYYQSTVRFTNKPNWFKLYSFRKKGSFSRYSRTEFEEFSKNQSGYLVQR